MASANAPVAVSGKINLSNGTNVSRNAIKIFVDATEQLSSHNVTDDSDTDFLLGVFNGTNISGIGGAANLTLNRFNATGGTITYVGGYTIHTFTSSGTFNVTSAGDVEYLVVGGGGAGGIARGGGGGAGGMLNATISRGVGSYTVTVGAGGTVTGTGWGTVVTSGSNSVFDTITAIGGGKGGGNGGTTGGSGGGSGDDGGGPYLGGSGTAGQGNRGGNSSVAGGATYIAGGGGGGAGAAGVNATSSSAGAGGAGAASSISGSSVTYAGGGGGGSAQANSGGAGGAGGGGAGSSDDLVAATDGTANRGGGGGGGAYDTGSGGVGVPGAGGSGIVIIRYPTVSYTPTGNFTSRIFDAGNVNANWTAISWSNTTPPKTNLSLHYRTSADNITYSDWNSVSNNIFSVTALNSTNRYFQYLALFNTSNILLISSSGDSSLNSYLTNEPP